MPPKPRTCTTRSSSNKKKLQLKTHDSTNLETASGLSQEAEDQFEVELCWCIQQLEMCLASGKLQEKQMHDLGKNINILRSNSAPLIKKRQIMRSTLGNYREKMALDEQKLSKPASTVKFTSSSMSSKKSVFLRKATDRSERDKHNSDNNTASENELSNSINNNNRTKDTFKFNFQNTE